MTLRNNGSAPLTSVQLQYVLNGGAPVVQTFALSPALAVGATQALTFAVPALVVAGPNTLTVTSSLPNGSPDGYPANDTQTLTLATALAGTYTINKSQPTGGVVEKVEATQVVVGVEAARLVLHGKAAAHHVARYHRRHLRRGRYAVAPGSENQPIARALKGSGIPLYNDQQLSNVTAAAALMQP